MSSCRATQSKFSEYLDGRLTGREMQRIAFHLENCRNCADEWAALQQTQSAISVLGPVPEPEDLMLRIRVAVSRERARQRKALFETWGLAWRNTIGPFLMQLSAGFASAVLLLGTVILMVGMFTQPEVAQAKGDEPLGNATAPRLL
jgi:anti-sigma factor RsiW